MSRLTVTAVALLVWGVAASQALGLGADHPKEELAKRGPNCVHGYFVNWEDVFFFAGDTAALNKFLDDYARTPNAELRVVLHPGPKKARSPWDKADRDIPVDWSLYTWNTGGKGQKPAPTRVDVWVGAKIKLDELRVPANVTVESGGEIEKFVEGHRNQKPKP
jgi:hypothetical protein